MREGSLELAETVLVVVDAVELVLRSSGELLVVVTCVVTLPTSAGEVDVTTEDAVLVVGLTAVELELLVDDGDAVSVAVSDVTDVDVVETDVEVVEDVVVVTVGSGSYNVWGVSSPTRNWSVPVSAAVVSAPVLPSQYWTNVAPTECRRPSG